MDFSFKYYLGCQYDAQKSTLILLSGDRSYHINLLYNSIQSISG